MKLGEVSFWYRQMGGLPRRRAPLDEDASCDVCIIGAGFTGLWAAYYLMRQDPGRKVLVVEKEFAGYGASGRNGGWMTGGFAWDMARYGAGGPALAAALRGAVPEIIRVAEAEGIEAEIHQTDELSVAIGAAQAVRMAEEARARQGAGEPVTLLSDAALAERLRIPGAMGAMVTPGVARVQPAKLVRGLAEAVERMGVRIAEGTEVLRYGPGFVETARGRVSAGAVLRATEGYTAGLAQAKRDWVPLNSAQIVTEPLPETVWRDIGWEGGELLGDFSHVYCYCSRLPGGRLAVGSRGVPYRFGSRTDMDGAPDGATVALLRGVLGRIFPAAAGTRIDHAWCGVLGVPRDWCATVGFDGETRVGFAGGYVGVGVSTSNLAGRSLADLVLGRETDRAALPWVNRPVRRWEPEPLRWLGVRGMYGLLGLADREERRRGAPSAWGRLGYWLAGR